MSRWLVAFSTRDAALGAAAGAAPTTAPDGYIPPPPATPGGEG